MAVVGMCGWESGLLQAEGSAIVGTCSASTTQKRTGAYSFRVNPASGANGNMQIQTFGISNYMHFGFYIASLPSITRGIFGSTGGTHLRLTSGGVIQYRNGAAAIGETAALNTGQWYWIGVRVASGTGVVCMQVDGVDSFSGNPVGSINNQIGCAGSEASAIDIYFDDFITDDTGFLAPSKVDTALPISDNTVTGVTDGNGGTSNLWESVNNTPPAGVASANEAANPTASIKFPASVTCNYIADLETYTTLGINSGDTVLAVQSFVRHGEDIATGTKNFQNFGNLTNPTYSSGAGNTAAGNDGGAHGAEPGLWTTTMLGVQTSPSVTLGTSPTIRVSRTAEARVACIDYMGMTVAWTPAAAAKVPYATPMPPILAQ